MKANRGLYSDGWFLTALPIVLAVAIWFVYAIQQQHADELRQVQAALDKAKDELIECRNFPTIPKRLFRDPVSARQCEYALNALEKSAQPSQFDMLQAAKDHCT